MQRLGISPGGSATRACVLPNTRSTREWCVFADWEAVCAFFQRDYIRMGFYVVFAVLSRNKLKIYQIWKKRCRRCVCGKHIFYDYRRESVEICIVNKFENIIERIFIRFIITLLYFYWVKCKLWKLALTNASLYSLGISQFSLDSIDVEILKDINIIDFHSTANTCYLIQFHPLFTATTILIYTFLQLFLSKYTN